MNNGLKHCPECGSGFVKMETEFFRPYGLKTGDLCYFVKCHHCGHKGGIGLTGYRPVVGTVTVAQAERIAVNKWNLRP